MSTTKEKLNVLEIAEHNLDRTINWISIIDSKALFMLTLILALLGYIFTKFDTSINLLFTLYNNQKNILFAIILTLLIVEMIGFIVSAVYLILIIYPKRLPYTQQNVSLFFYETISKMPIVNFSKDFSSLKINKALEQINDQTYNNAKVVKNKFDQLSISIKWFSFSLATFFIYMVVQAILTKIYLVGG
ncbi:MAG: hypothetical protein KF758_12875 [Anaerolineales bacterium]|nr:hypothetical protein [Anaerolineales bacterium]